MYQSIPSLTITPDDPEDSHVLTAWGIASVGASRFVSKKLEAASKAGVLVLFHVNF